MIVTQAMLAEFAAGRSLLKGQEDLRQRIVHLLEEDAPVEPGRFDATLRKTSQKRLTKGSLGAVIGMVKVDEILAKLPPTEITSLTVEENQ